MTLHKMICNNIMGHNMCDITWHDVKQTWHVTRAMYIVHVHEKNSPLLFYCAQCAQYAHCAQYACTMWTLCTMRTMCPYPAFVFMSDVSANGKAESKLHEQGFVIPLSTRNRDTLSDRIYHIWCHSFSIIDAIIGIREYVKQSHPNQSSMLFFQFRLPDIKGSELIYGCFLKDIEQILFLKDIGNIGIVGINCKVASSVV